MKIGEIRELIGKYSKDDLAIIVVEMYRAVPKQIKKEKGIDNIILNPKNYLQSRKRRREPVRHMVDLDEIESEIEEFVEYAYNQYYFAPNQFVHKKDRPKWRFKVKRYYKELTRVTEPKDAVQKAGELLGQLYEVLCYGCGHWIFTSDDPFRSVGIEQRKFFQQVLALKYDADPKAEFIKDAIKLMLNSEMDSTTVHGELIHVLVNFLETDDMKRVAIAKCDIVRDEILNTMPAASGFFSYDTAHYKIKEQRRYLAEIGFQCYIGMGNYKEGIEYFKNKYDEKDKEITLYVLLDLLRKKGLKDHWVCQYEQALQSGIGPRDSLKNAYKFILENDKLPKYL